jgi:glutaredoxin
MSEKEINYMITQEGCGACKQAKELLKDVIASGKIEPVDVKTKKGLKLAQRHNVRATPTIINKNGDLEQKCLLSKDGTKMVCENGEEKKLSE